jgi:nucleoside transporter
MNQALRLKLSVMMFIQYFIWGTWYVAMGSYMGHHNFSGPEIGNVYAIFSLAAMVAPFFVGMVADRYFATQKILGILHMLGAIFLFLAGQKTDYKSFFLLIMAHCLCYTPTMALTNSLSFHHMSDPGRQFPGIRVLGTIGWIAAGLSTVESLWQKNIALTSIPFNLGAGASFLMGLYCFTLPNTPPKGAGTKASLSSILGLDALKLFRDRSFVIFALGSFLLCIPLAFYYANTNLFLTEVGITNATSKMTVGQMSEIFFMLVMPFFFVRLGIKKMLLIGMGAWTVRYLLFAYGNASNLVYMFYAGIVLHGICYDFFFVTGQIYVDRQASVAVRGAAQGLIAFLTYGFGMFVGSLISGNVLGKYTLQPSGHDWRHVWLVPAIGAGAVLILFALFFKEPAKKDA